MEGCKIDYGGLFLCCSFLMFFIFGECELTFTFVRYMLSPFRLSSVCLSCVMFVHATRPVEIFCNFFFAIWYPGYLFTSTEIFRRSSQGNPSFGGFKRKRGSKI